VTSLRASIEHEAVGLDVMQHGEEAYVTGEGAILIEPDGDGRPADHPEFAANPA
jgi:hypothetical protein